MLLTIPYQSIELSKFQLHPFTIDKKGRKVARISYFEGLNDITIMTPPLSLLQYEPSINRIQFDTTKDRAFNNKWNAIQALIADMMYMNSNSIFSRGYTMEEIQSILHSLLVGHCLTAYVFPTTAVQKADGTTCPITEVPVGTSIRCIFRIHGLMLVDHKGNPSIRIQHSIPEMYMV